MIYSIFHLLMAIIAIHSHLLGVVIHLIVLVFRIIVFGWGQGIIQRQVIHVVIKIIVVFQTLVFPRVRVHHSLLIDDLVLLVAVLPVIVVEVMGLEETRDVTSGELVVMVLVIDTFIEVVGLHLLALHHWSASFLEFLDQLLHRDWSVLALFSFRLFGVFLAIFRSASAISMLGLSIVRVRMKHVVSVIAVVAFRVRIATIGKSSRFWVIFFLDMLASLHVSVHGHFVILGDIAQVYIPHVPISNVTVVYTGSTSWVSWD